MIDKEKLDILKKIEELTSKLNESFGKKGKSVFERYPLAFALLVIVGATLMSQGIKELILKISIFNNHPVVTFFAGILILTITGTLYKKLEK
jgi:hypothetical protein